MKAERGNEKEEKMWKRKEYNVEYNKKRRTSDRCVSVQASSTFPSFDAQPHRYSCLMAASPVHSYSPHF